MADRYLVKSGNWNSTSVWSATNGGAGGASVPTDISYVFINNNYVVTLTADANCAGLIFSNGTIKVMSYKLTIGNNVDEPGYIYSYGSAARELDLGSGVLHLLGNYNDLTGLNFNGSNYTISGGSSTVIIDADSGESPYDQSILSIGNSSLNDVVINLGSGSSNSVQLDITGSPTFRSLIIQSKNSEAHTVNFDSSMAMEKLVAIGSSSSNKLSLSYSGGIPINFDIPATGSSYGQYVAISNIVTTTYLDYPYIGSNSTDDTGNWLLQDPPKISTLVDPLTTAPGSNTNWTVTGTVTKRTDSFTGGGYNITSSNSMSSVGTYDFVGSTIVLETYRFLSTGDPASNEITISDGISLFQFSMNPYDFSQWRASNGNRGSLVRFLPPADGGGDGTLYPKFVKASVGVDGVVSVSFSENGSVWRNAVNGGGGMTEPTLTLDDISMLSLRSARVVIESASSEYPYTLGSINPNLNSPPTTTLTTPANGTTLTTDKPALTFKATDPDGDAVTYQVQVFGDIGTDTSFFEESYSTAGVGWSGSNPYTSGSNVTYTMQTNLQKGGVVYYWLARAKDPSGSNTWGAWSSGLQIMTTEALPPSVTYTSTTGITTTAASVAGSATPNGASITDKGTAYGLTASPTTSGTKVSNGSGAGSFTSNITGLTSNTTYNVRTYAINSKGTTYSDNQTFKTLPIPPTVTGISTLTGVQSLTL